MAEIGNSYLEIKDVLENYPFLSQFLQNIKHVVWLQDPKTDQILFVSSAYETVWGRSCASLYEDPFSLIKSIHPEDRVKVMSTRLEDLHEFLEQSYRILRPDGSMRWISAYAFLINNNPQGAYYQVCVAQDTTDQNHVDQTLRRALDRSREQFTLSRRMSLARKPESVLKTLMSTTELRTAKRAFVLFFETPMSNLHDFDILASWSTLLDLTNADPDMVLNETTLVEELVLLGLFNPSKTTMISDITKNQRLTPIVKGLLEKKQIRSLAIFPLVALGKWLGCLLVFFPMEKNFEPIDLRHIKVLVDQAAITLYNLQLLKIEAESRHEAEKATEIKTRFLAMISHELRTPLTSIKGFTTTLLADDVTWEPEEQRDFYQTIDQEADRLQELIDHLLDLSRLEEGMLPITMQPHSFTEIITDVLPQFETMTKNHALSVRMPPNLPQVNVDNKRIAQVLVNLVHNAATYTPEGTKILLSATVRGDRLQVSVSDLGPGIPPAEHKRVFQAFRRGIREENGSGKGAGLGLAICKGLVEAHGGKIWIKKQTSSGATISFTIPIVQPNVVVIPSE